MKKHTLILLTLTAALTMTAVAVDGVDVMLRKIFGADSPPLAPPLALTAHALAGKDNSVAVNAYNGALEFQGSTYDSHATRLAVTDPTENRTVTLPDGSGVVGLEAKAVLTAGATVSFAPGASVSCYTLTPGEDETISAVTTGAVPGRAYFLVVTTSGTTSRTLTFGTGFKVSGTLATGTVNAKTLVLCFIYDGSAFNEVSRTAAM